MWSNVFERQYHKLEGATQDELDRLVKTWNEKLSPQEIAGIAERQKNPFPVNDPLHEEYKPFDPSLWDLPQKKLPDSYLDFLRYSNGGEFTTGDRYFQFFGTKELREYNLAYEFPEYMAGSVSIGMDGCGNHYILDMRDDMIEDEYPILAAHSGNLGYEDEEGFTTCKQVALSFPELCKGTTSIDEELNED
ncbi:SMI1 / KNR4 family (SUKH-1) [Paenibacillus tianmuensis]|uniref:SMI1 / KNR4 family (SUKH-1) n=1 Tax=Paenibacillus tianmuensis TaxID=624147 RepID=A0A1G4P9R1_9BACL|nr:SMI1/KNR4 family protein [Paenibacillus tianmuensis]SCW28819.1 SMI1 / KNR4 family (SUKH-1) [Paenibacillus tianmuensis]